MYVYFNITEEESNVWLFQLPNGWLFFSFVNVEYESCMCGCVVDFLLFQKAILEIRFCVIIIVHDLNM